MSNSYWAGAGQDSVGRFTGGRQRLPGSVHRLAEAAGLTARWAKTPIAALLLSVPLVRLLLCRLICDFLLINLDLCFQKLSR